MKPSRPESKGRLAPSGIVQPPRQRPHGAEPAQRERHDRRLDPARQHRVGHARPDVHGGIPDRHAGCGAGRALGRERAARAERHRHLGRAHVGDQRGDPERAQPVGARLEQLGVGDLLRLQPADARADRAADPGRVGAHVQVGVGDRLRGGRDGQVREAVGLPHRALVHVLGRVEPLHLPGDVHRALGHLEALDARHTRPSRPDVRPGVGHRQSAGRDRTHPRDHDPSPAIALISPTPRPPPARLRSQRPPHPTRGTAPPGRRRPARPGGRAASAPGSPRGPARAERR